MVKFSGYTYVPGQIKNISHAGDARRNNTNPVNHTMTTLAGPGTILILVSVIFCWEIKFKYIIIRKQKIEI